MKNLKTFIAKLSGKKQKTVEAEDELIFSQNEKYYAYRVILAAMQEQAQNEGTTLVSQLSQLHKELISTEAGKKLINGVDTFGLISEARDSVKGIDYREEIKDHGKSYIWSRMIQNRKIMSLERHLESPIKEGVIA